MIKRSKAPDFERMAREAGYRVIGIEQLRSNRWLLTLSDGDGRTILVLAQARSLISSADVQDLWELVRLRNPAIGILLALDGSFSPGAHQTCAELRDRRLHLCTSLPPAAVPAIEESSVRSVLASSR
ncbi:MAG: hypothetical protein NZ699_19120 [Roseiflexus sp.]|nr:hypothetical protein [Roseiflexus sp.]MDW8232012.1 hypothetical protein [Roseiflexaceae bacterium]